MSRKARCRRCDAVVETREMAAYRTNSLYFESDCWVDADQAFHAEEAECAGMYLTKLGVPKHNNDGEKLSLVGRIQMAMVMFPPKTYKPND